jgi:purine-nucleoside phosphorylase
MMTNPSSTRTQHSWYTHPDEMMASMNEAADTLERAWRCSFDVCIVAGSGVSSAIESWECRGQMDVGTVPGFSTFTVHGHTNRLSWMRVSGTDVLVFHGRRHLYEGVALRDAVAPVLLAGRMGVKRCVLTNAAGGMNPTFSAGDLMIVSDFVNATGRAVAVRGSHGAALIDKEWSMRLFHACGPWHADTHASVRKGVYVSVLGPSYETRAEIGMYAHAADAIGMSTVHEAQAAAQLGMSVVAVSVISNTLHEAPASKLTHEEVVQVAAKSGARLGDVLEASVRTSRGRHER